MYINSQQQLAQHRHLALNQIVYKVTGDHCMNIMLFENTVRLPATHLTGHVGVATSRHCMCCSCRSK